MRVHNMKLTKGKCDVHTLRVEESRHLSVQVTGKLLKSVLCSFQHLKCNRQMLNI